MTEGERPLRSPWVKGPPGATGAGLRLFCFAHAGGGSTLFRPWQTPLLPDVEVCTVVLPGRESRFREPLYTRMAELVADLTEGLTPYLDREYAFFGHSLGSVVAYEVACRLRRLGAAGPSALLVSARRAPHLPGRHRRLFELTDEELVTEMVKLGGTPAELLGQRQMFDLFLPTLRADLELNETYQSEPAGPLLSCPVFAFGGDRDPLANSEELDGWRHVTRGGFRLHIFPGDHFYLKDAPADLIVTLRTRMRMLRRDGAVSRRTPSG